MDDTDVIKEPNHVILHVNKSTYLFTQVTSTSVVRLSRQITRASLAPLLGAPFGSFFEFRGDRFVRLPREPVQALKTAPSEADHNLDNRNLENNSQSQKLTKEEIEQMKKDGRSGEEIIKALASSSATFSVKTEMAKEKWIKKKQKKYMKVIQVIKPTSLTICKVYSEKKKNRICALRFDTLAQILTWANIYANQKILVFEETGGLIVGSVAERLGGFGFIYSVFEGQQPNRSVERLFNYEKKLSDTIKYVPLHELVQQQTLNSPGISNAAALLQHVAASGGVDALIIVARGSQTPLKYLLALYPLLAPSAQFCVYSQFIESLAACHASLKTENAGVNLKLSETWLREYQVLPMRTHPTMQMNGNSGFILTGTKVTSDFGKGYTHLLLDNKTIQKDSESPPPQKKQKLDQ